jgi:hypothetical protein
MINWLYAPGITFKELAVSAKAKWDDYYNFAHAPGFGSKDPSESWSAWCVLVRTVGGSGGGGGGGGGGGDFISVVFQVPVFSHFDLRALCS